MLDRIILVARWLLAAGSLGAITWACADWWAAPPTVDRVGAVLGGVRLLIIFAGVAGVIFAVLGPNAMPSCVPPCIDRLIPGADDRRDH